MVAAMASTTVPCDARESSGLLPGDMARLSLFSPDFCDGYTLAGMVTLSSGSGGCTAWACWPSSGGDLLRLRPREFDRWMTVAERTLRRLSLRMICACARRREPKRPVRGVGLVEPSLRLANSFRELPRSGTGNGGPTERWLK
jgi:hypothetical protein